MDLDYFEDILKLSPVTVVSTVLVILLGILYLFLKDRDLPPGPTGIPLLGCWPILQDQGIHFHLTDLMKKYGEVYSFNVTGQLYIHLGSIKSLKEAHVTKSDCFTERYQKYSALSIFFGEGVASANGEKWKALRKFFIQAFKEYGLTSMKGYLSGPIYDSVNASVESLKATNGSPVNIISVLNDRSAEIFRRMVFNDAEITDEELKGVLECYQNILTLFEGKNVLLMGEFARYFVFPTRKGYRFSLENHKKVVEYLTTLIRRHEQTYSEDNIRDVIDSYLRERNERRQKGDPSAEYFSENSLVSSLIQITGDGILGIAIFIAYFIHALLEYPEEQEKIYKELVDVIGPDRQITLEDRNKLPYTNAFLQEVMRTTDFFTILPSLVCTKETTLNGYRIPKGSITMLNLWACHHDPNTFDEPDEFKPSRYTNEPNKPKVEAPLIFGIGKRSCAGEAFTMMQVFLFLTNIIKNFRLERPKGNVKKTFLDGIMEVCVNPRK